MRPARRLCLALIPTLLVSVALVGSLLGAASIPHSHNPGHPGLYNQEHDLGYLATFGGSAPLPDASFAVPLMLVVVLTFIAAGGATPVLWRRHADFRAPPPR
jgi:hypothetical protein